MTDYTKLVLDQKYSRRGFIAAAGASAFLAACGGSTDSSSDEPAGTAEGGTATGDLLYYNWVDYVNPETYKTFAADTDVSVKKDFYESNEELQAKLQAGARGFDLIVPTGYMVQILAEADLLQELDHAEMPNVDKNIDPKFTGPPVRPGRQVLGAQGLGNDRVHLPHRHGQGEPDELERFLRAGQGPVLRPGDGSRRDPGSDRIHRRDARLLLQHR